MKKDKKKETVRKKWIKAALLAFVTAWCASWPSARAYAAEKERDIVSAGSIVFENSSGSVGIYAEDIALLKETFGHVRAETYDPASYGHVHQWEYTDITESGHSERCTRCGASGGPGSTHTEAFSEKCALTYDGMEYPGYRYVCACGFEWIRERYHTPLYTPTDAVSHAAFCALQGTTYCTGMGEAAGEHISALRPTDETHHRAVCIYCDYAETEQACVFDREDQPDDNSQTEPARHCECGNRLMTEETGNAPELPNEGAGADDSEPPAIPSEEESEETPSAPPEKDPEDTTPAPPEKDPEDATPIPPETEPENPAPAPPNAEPEDTIPAPPAIKPGPEIQHTKKEGEIK